MAKSNTPSCPFETIAENEAEQIAETTDLTVKLLDKRYTSQQKKILRGVHPKSHGCVKATFEINTDLDEYLQVGLFANPGKKYSPQGVTGVILCGFANFLPAYRPFSKPTQL